MNEIPPISKTNSRNKKSRQNSSFSKGVPVKKQEEEDWTAKFFIK